MIEKTGMSPTGSDLGQAGLERLKRPEHLLLGLRADFGNGSGHLAQSPESDMNQGALVLTHQHAFERTLLEDRENPDR